MIRSSSATAWDFLIDEAALASILTEAGAQFCRPVREALIVFLNGLPLQQQHEIFERQSALPADASLAKRLGHLARVCPTLHKLGQILARDERLSVELRQHLQELESLPPSTPMHLIQESLVQEFGALDSRGIVLGDAPLAEASVAVVTPFRDARRANFEGVFKILKPGIEERLERELELLEDVGEHLERRCTQLGIPPLDYREIFAQVRERLRHEVRLDLEQRHLEQARLFYAGDESVLIPRVHECCSSRVTAMERIHGQKVTDYAASLGPNDADKSQLSRRLVEALLGRSIYARTQRALFHADPHAGNLFIAPDGRLAILDWSLVGSLSVENRQAMTQMILAALALDAAAIVRILSHFDDQRRADSTLVSEIVERWLWRIRAGAIPGFGWLMGLMDDVVLKTRISLPIDLVLFRKTIFMVSGVCKDLGAASQDVERMLLEEFLTRFVSEWPRRFWTPLNSRDFSTQLSTSDLIGLMSQLPWTWTRFWFPAKSHGA